ncbi:MAG: hypothetical protein ABI579_09900, partial [Candidatus Sumerlaeota bacterium]
MSPIAKPIITVYDTKPYDREYLEAAVDPEALHLRFNAFRLEPDTVFSAEGARAICVFVNDHIDRPILE